MKKEELTALGLTEEQAEKVLEMRGKDVTKLQGQITTLTDDKAKIQTQLDAANETLEKFKDVDVEQIQKELEEHKNRADKAEKDYAAKLTSRDQDDWLKGKLDEYGVTSPYARKQLINEVKDADNGLKWKDKAFVGFDDFMKSAKEADSSLYLTDEEKKALDNNGEGTPYFTSGGDSKGSGAGGEPPKIPSLF